MEVLWFCVVIFMLTMYAILDGFDLGAGVIHLFLSRTEKERGSVLAAAGPFWDGNEVWLLLAGGALYCAFPAVYSAPGFYILAVVLLWLLILRGIGAVVRSRAERPSWRRVLDIGFGVSSLLLSVALGAAVACVIRGVPPTGGSRTLNWFPVLCGVFALACLTLESAAWMALKSSGAWQRRCRSLASRVWWAVLFCYAAVTAASFAVQPHLLKNLQTYSWISVFAVFALAGLIGARLCLSVGFDLGTFASASCLIAGLLASAAAGQFPYLLSGLTVYNAGSAHVQLGSSAVWWITPFLLAIGYSVSVRRFGKQAADQSRMANVHPQPMMTAGD
jgi:cytochrome d ubiquinol oxidase subunit II